MNKKLIISIFTVFMLVAISYATAINTKSIGTDVEKASPLYKFRAERACTPLKEYKELRNAIKSRFLGENRIFFIQEPNANGDLAIRGLMVQKFFTDMETRLLCCYLTLGICSTVYILTCAPRGCGV